MHQDGCRVSTKRSGWPWPAAVKAKSRITIRPRKIVATAQPLVFMPSNGVQPQVEAIQSFEMVRVWFRSTMVKSPSQPRAIAAFARQTENALRPVRGQIHETLQRQVSLADMVEQQGHQRLHPGMPEGVSG